MGQLGLGLVERRGRVGQVERGVAGDDVFVRRAGDRGAVGVLGHRQRDGGDEAGVAGARALVPAAPDERVAARHQEGFGEHRRIGDGAGSLPPGTRPKVFQVLRPRLGGSYIILCAPFFRSIGLRM